LLQKSAGYDFGTAYLAKSVTLGTRVRIKFKVMARICAGKRETMDVSAFLCRPLIHVKQGETDGRSMAFTFADALKRFGEQLKQSDPGDAYRRAGNSLTEQLQQNLVVLHEN
jgi:hypothetical protein